MSRICFTALLLLGSSFTSTASAQTSSDIRFETDARSDDYVRLRFDRDWDDDDRGNWRGNWSQRIAIADLGSATAEALKKDGPVRFSYVRPAGRFDCNGTSDRGWANGRCTFTVNDAFSKYLADHGIERPSHTEYYGLAASGVDSAVIDAVIAEGMGTPTPQQLVGLGIFNITPDFVRSMSRINGMKVGIGDLVQFKIFKITPESVRAYAALGYRELKPRDLVTFSIHRITPDYIRELADLGYRDISTGTLVQMRIFGITPAYVRTAQARSSEKLTPEQLVRRRFAPPVNWNRNWDQWARDWSRNWSENWDRKDRPERRDPRDRRD